MTDKYVIWSTMLSAVMGECNPAENLTLGGQRGTGRLGDCESLANGDGEYDSREPHPPQQSGGRN
eukprot:2171028-Pleurochrysis_carterae.AAC.1